MRGMTLLVLAASAATAGCRGENRFANSDPTLVNTPHAFEAVRFEVVNQAGESVDLITQGALFQLSLDEEAETFESSFRFDALDIDVSGTFEILPGAIVFSDDPFEDDDLIIQREFEFEEVGSVLFLEDPETVWDIDNDGVDEIVSLDIRLDPVN
ncbi:MAG: hypothetical protein ACOCVZ_04020 [Gemmatimonadota bacterium]